jgi:hypothetical protein
MANTLATLTQQFDKDIVTPLQAYSMGKKLIPLNPKFSGQGIGVINIKTARYIARADAVTNYDLQDTIGDTVDLNGFELFIPIQQDEIKIKRRDWEAYAYAGVPIESDIATDMSQKIATEQSKVILDGWKPKKNGDYVIKGMLQVAKETVELSDYSSFGKALKDVNSSITKLKQNFIYSADGYNVTYSTNLMDEVGANYDTGRLETELILTSLNRGVTGTPGQIFEGPTLPDDTALVSPVASQGNKTYFDIIETQQPKNNLWFADGNADSGDVKGRQYGALVPRFKHLNTATMLDPCVVKIAARSPG